MFTHRVTPLPWGYQLLCFIPWCFTHTPQNPNGWEFEQTPFAL
jgi:hypothetical protein